METDNISEQTTREVNPVNNLTKKERRALRRQEKEEEKNRQQKSRKARILSIWVGVALLVGGGILGMVWLAGKDSGGLSNNEASLVDAVNASDRIKGNTEGQVELVEYSDLQCPACKSYYPLVKQLVEEFSRDVKFVYRHFPLKQIHPNAELAARASEAAGQQDKFWEMHDLLFERQSEWSHSSNNTARDQFIGYAISLELDRETFENDLDSDIVKEKVDNDYQSGVSAGVVGTPTFFVNGEKITNPAGYDAFRDIVQQEISSNP
jgi:protein-disulfide isomerase